jgi:acyl phosphate:glycerol-3-phosphate acyltransferase
MPSRAFYGKPFNIAMESSPAPTPIWMLTLYPSLIASPRMDPLIDLKTALVLLAAYSLGCLATGYYLVRFHANRDIRQTGSGSSGATNVSRVLGWSGFLITLAADAGKGGLAVILARLCELDRWAVWAAALAVIAGHIWPVQLRFRGGKGAATYLGAVATLEWRIALLLFPLALAGYLLTRQQTLAGLGAMALLPAGLWLLGFHLDAIVGSTALAVLVLSAHRANIREGIGEIRLDEGMGSE